MLHIALCDDENEQRQFTQQITEELLNKHKIAAKISVFSSARQLLNAVDEYGVFDLYILDIVMPEINGIDLGKALRTRDSKGTIIYLTTSPDFALESYETKAFYYLLKPVNKEKFSQVILDAINFHNKHHEESIQLKTHHGVVRLLFDDILYAELKNRAARYYLNDGNFVDTMTLSTSFKDAMQPLLEGNRFLLCGASFVVNLYYVKMVDKADIAFHNGKILSLPKAACSALRTVWSDYWLEGGNTK